MAAFVPAIVILIQRYPIESIMSAHVTELRVEIVRFVQEHQPSIVEWKCVDAGGRSHTFIGKDAMCSHANLDSQSKYPQARGMRCIAVSSWRDDDGREIVRVSTAQPDDLDSVEELTEFVVLRDQISPWSARIK